MQMNDGPIRHPPPPSSASSVSSRRSSGSVSAASSASSAASEEDYVGDDSLAPSDASEVDASEVGAEDDDDEGEEEEDDEEDDEEEEESADEGVARVVCIAGGAATDASLALLRRSIEAAFGVESSHQHLVVSRSSASAPELLGAADGQDDDTWPLQRLQLGSIDEIELEVAGRVDSPSRLHARREAQHHRIELLFNSPGREDFTHGILVDVRSTVAKLKSRIAARLRVRRDALRLRRAARGAHVTAQMESWCVGEGGLELDSGDVLYVEEGAPLSDGEMLIRHNLPRPSTTFHDLS